MSPHWLLIGGSPNNLGGCGRSFACLQGTTFMILHTPDVRGKPKPKPKPLSGDVQCFQPGFPGEAGGARLVPGGLTGVERTG